MLQLGLIISIIIYLSDIGVLALYFHFFFKKKYEKANSVFMLFFLHSLIVIMILSWSIILMNGGFGVNFYLNIEYNWLLIIFAIFFISIIITNYYIKKNINLEKSVFSKIALYLLPLFNVILFTTATLLFFFNFNYFWYLSI